MKQQILNILNPVHIPTIGEWMEIAGKLHIGRKKDTLELNHHLLYTTFKLQQRFEELTRGKWVTSLSLKSPSHGTQCRWQPVLLKREMFEDEDAWFESKLATMQFPDNAELWYWIIEMGRIKSSWSFTENFVKTLLK